MRQLLRVHGYLLLAIFLGFQHLSEIQAQSGPPYWVSQNVGPPLERKFHWKAQVNKVYFFKFSTDMVNWTWMKIARKSLANSDLSISIPTEYPKYFILPPLSASIGAGEDPLLADSDGDGIPNGVELAHNSSPLTDSDLDHDGLLDSWELKNFSNLSFGGDDDNDEDGKSNFQEMYTETNPSDYWEGRNPSFQLLSEASIFTAPGQETGQPFAALVTNAATGEPLVNAPVLASATVIEDNISYPPVLLKTDHNGFISFHYQNPNGVGKNSDIFLARSTPPGTGTTTFSKVFHAATVGAPANDLLINARALTNSPLGSLPNQTNQGAVIETSEPRHARLEVDPYNLSISPKFMGASVWYKWKAPASGPFQFETNGVGFDPLCAIYEGPELNPNFSSLTLIADNDNNEASVIPTSNCKVHIQAVHSRTYYIAIDGFTKSTGRFALLWSASTAPINDKFSQATLLVDPQNYLLASTMLATTEYKEPSHANSPAMPSLWYKWIAPANGYMAMNSSQSAVDTVLAVYRGSTNNNIENLTRVTHNDDRSNEDLTSKIAFSVSQGTSYFIALSSSAFKRGNVRLNWDFVSSDLPPHDSFEASQDLTTATDEHFNNAFATHEEEEGTHAEKGDAKSLWFHWDVPGDLAEGTQVRLDISSSSFNPVVAVYQGTAINDLNNVISNDDVSFNNWNSSVTFTANPGARYFIAVDANLYDLGGDQGGRFAINWILIDPPVEAPSSSKLMAQSAFETPKTISLENFSSSSKTSSNTTAGVWNTTLPPPPNYQGSCEASYCLGPPYYMTPKPNKGETYWMKWMVVNGNLERVERDSIDIVLVAPEEQIPGGPPVARCSQTVENIVANILIGEGNARRPRMIEGKFFFKATSGNPSEVADLKVWRGNDHSQPPIIYTFGQNGEGEKIQYSEERILCGFCSESVGASASPHLNISPKRAGSFSLEAVFDPDVSDGGDGVPTRNLAINVRVIDLNFEVKPQGGGVKNVAIQAKTSYLLPDLIPNSVQDIRVPEVPGVNGEEIELEVDSVNPNIGPGYQPGSLGKITKVDTGHWKYEAFEESKNARRAEEKEVLIKGYYRKEFMCAIHRVTVAPVFQWLIHNKHIHDGGDGATHLRPTPEDYEAALKYTMWKYNHVVNPKDSAVRYQASGPNDYAEGYTQVNQGMQIFPPPRLVNIYPKAFANIENWVASAVGHENIHAGQQTDKLSLFWNSLRFKKWENPAYRWEQANMGPGGTYLDNTLMGVINQSVTNTAEGNGPGAH